MYAEFYMYETRAIPPAVINREAYQSSSSDAVFLCVYVLNLEFTHGEKI